MADSEMGDLEMADLEMADSEMADSEMADSEMTNPENPFHLLLAHSESYLEFEQKLLSLDDEKLQSSCFGQFINTLFNVLPNHQSYHQLADLPPEQQEMVDSLDGTVGLHGVLKKKLENQYCLVQVVFRSRVSEPIPKKKIHPLLFKRPSLSLGSVLVTNTLEITGSIKSRNFQLFNRDQLVINAFKFWNQIKKFGLKDKKWVVYHPTKLIPPLLAPLKSLRSPPKGGTNYICPRCGYQAPRKGTMRRHFNKQKICRNTYQIELSDEVKEIVLRDKVYYRPKRGRRSKDPLPGPIPV